MMAFDFIKVILAAIIFSFGAFAQTVWNGTADISWYNSSQNSFTITTAEQLAGLAQLVNDGNRMQGKTITLGNNIMLNDTTNWQNWATTAPARTWTAIGSNINSFCGTFDGNGFVVDCHDGKPYNFFRGTFDGNGFVVGGVYINNVKDYQGLFGYFGGDRVGTIKNLGVVASYVKGHHYVGGLAGGNFATIINCYFTGNVTGDNHVGGLAGVLYSYSNTTNCYASGEVFGYHAVGGLAGYAWNAVINNSYAAGNVTGNNSIGGFLGSYDGTSGSKITNCYAIGMVTGVRYSGGLVGGDMSPSSNTTTNSYYDSQTSGQTDADKGTPKTTAQMKQQSTYTGWDFNAIWHISSNINNGYPYLREFLRYPVTFNANGGSAVSPSLIMGISGRNISKPSDPTRNGYTFNGWWTAQTGGSQWNFNTDTVTAAVTLYARWTPITYIISYDCEGGINNSSNPVNYTIETENITLQSPTRKDFAFVGWFDNRTGGNQVTAINKGSTGNKTLYARWTPIIFTVTFNSNGGSGVLPVNVNSGEKITKPNDPTKAGSIFAHWYSYENDGENQWNFNTNTVTKNITLHAIWEDAGNVIRLPDDVVFTYDNTQKEFNYVIFVGLDGRKTMLTKGEFGAVYTNAKNSGRASVTITYQGDNNELITVTKQFTIQKRPIIVTWKNTRLIWNDELQAPAPSVAGTAADKLFSVEVEAITRRKNVGINYVARAFCPDTNVIISEGKEEFYDIEKRGIDVAWGNERSFVYDKKEHAPIATAQIDFGDGRITPVQLWVPNRRIAAGEYTSKNNAAAIAEITAPEIRDNAYLTSNTNTCDFVINKKPLKVRLENIVDDTVKIENGGDFATQKGLEDYLTGLLEYDGFATGSDGGRDDESVLQGSPKVSIREITENNNAPHFTRAESLMDLIRLYEVTIETENVRADNYTPQAQEGIILSISSFLGTSVGKVEKSDSRCGVRITGDNIVTRQKAEISVVIPIPDSDKTEIAKEIKVVIYDNTGNVIYSGENSSISGAKVTWHLTNAAGRNVANGSYLIIAEAKGGKTGKSYWYSAKIGVKR